MKKIKSLQKISRNICKKPTEKGCHLWKGYKHRQGYGKVFFANTYWLAHRLIWTIANGAIPKDLVLMHSCDITGCVNLNHLILGTQKENIKDRDQKRRHWAHKL